MTEFLPDSVFVKLDKSQIIIICESLIFLSDMFQIVCENFLNAKLKKLRLLNSLKPQNFFYKILCSDFYE